MRTLEAIKRRKSPEIFLSTPVAKKDIKTIVESGNYAPIFGKIHFTVIDNTDLMNSIDKISIEMMKHSGNAFAEKMANTPGYHALRNAPVAIVLSAKGGNDENGFNMANISCAAENMLLCATELGIGSRFVMGPIMALNQEPIKSALHLPNDYIPLVMVLLGNIEDSFEERSKTSENIYYL